MAAPLAIASIGMSVVGGVMGAMGQQQAGAAANQMYQYRAAVSQMNSRIAEQNADYSLRVGEADAQREGMKTRAMVGGLRAKAAASGIDANTGSKSQLVESAEQIGEFGQQTARADAAKRAYGHHVEAANATAQGALYRAAGAEEERAGNFKAMGTLIGTASSVADKWMAGNQSGLWG